MWAPHIDRGWLHEEIQGEIFVSKIVREVVLIYTAKCKGSLMLEPKCGYPSINIDTMIASHMTDTCKDKLTYDCHTRG